MNDKNTKSLFTLAISFSFVSLLLCLYVLFLDKTSGIALFKIGFMYLMSIAIFFLWATFLIYKNASVIAANILDKYNASEKLLIDLRDGTKRFYSEKRKSYRVKADMTAQLLTKGVNDFIKTVDLSYDGAQLRTTREFQIGDVIGLNLYLPSYAKPINVRVKVMRVIPEKSTDGKPASYNVGVKYLEMPPDDRAKLTETLGSLDKKSSK
jgi:hypothetical protein